jgi:hypothetical protein
MLFIDFIYLLFLVSLDSPSETLGFCRLSLPIGLGQPHSFPIQLRWPRSHRSFDSLDEFIFGNLAHVRASATS